MKNTKKTSLAIIVAMFLMAQNALGVTTAQNSTVSNARRSYVAALPAEIIYQKSTDAVFSLETFDIDGESIRTGSGFFISDTGLAVTNLHVIDGAASATITLSSGEVFPVQGVHGTSYEHNLAVISMDPGEHLTTYLTYADSDLIETGNTVYTIGNPMGYANTMTSGIIGKTNREVDGGTLIQFTAPISFGSGGSPLLNTQGQVIGVASSSFSYGQNLNLAVPINHAKVIDIGESVTLESLLVF